MNKTRVLKTIAVCLVLSLAALASCGKTKSQDQLVIVYGSAESKIVRGGKSVPASTGLLLHEGDQIETGNSTMDIQARSGARVRLQKYTTLRVADLASSTRLKLNNGRIMARVDRQKSDRDFHVVTPTAIAGVRGTTFEVEADEESGTRVTVLDGQVALKPNVPTATEASAEAKEANPVLQQISTELDQSEQVLEAGQAGSLSPETIKEVKRIEESLQQKDNPQSAEAEAETAGAQEAAPGLKLDAGSSVQVENADIGLRQKAEADTLVGVDDAVLQEALGKEDKSAVELAPEMVEKVNNSYEANQTEAIKALEQDTLKDVNIANEEDIKKHYSFVEVVNLDSGATMSGAVLAQTGGYILVHSRTGLERVAIAKVNFIDYIDQ